MNSCIAISKQYYARWVFTAALFLLAIIAYRNSFTGAFVFDDGLCILDPPGIKDWIPDAGEKFTTGWRRWLTHLTIVANYKAHGYNVFGYHVVNLGIHLAATLLLFGIVRRSLLLPASRTRFEQAASGIAVVVAAIWLVHPLQTESVTYIVQRLESLAGMLFLLTLYALLRGALAEGWRTVAWYAAAIVTVSVGVGSKETMFLAPLVALGFDRVYLTANWREVWHRRGLVYLAMLPAFAWSLYSLKGSFLPSSKVQMGFGLQGISPWEYLRSQPGVILHYLRLTFWPQGQCLDYGWPVEHDPWRIYGLGAIIVALVVATLWAQWYRPRIGYVALMFFIMLAPTSSFMPIRDLAFEHRMYLPLASIAILVVLGCYELAQRGLQSPAARVAVPVLCAVLVVGGLTATTIKRNRVYHDPVDLWTDVTLKAPWNTRGHYNLGECLVARGMQPGGLAQYRHFLLYDAKAVRRTASREEFKAIEGDLAAAVASFKKTFELDPRDASAHFNLGGVYDRAKQPENAIFHYRQTLKINKRHLNARLNLARLLADQGEVAEATAQYEKALRVAPQDARPRVAFSKSLSEWGRHAEATTQLRQAVRLEPHNLKARFRLALSLWELDEQREAIGLLRAIRQEDPSLRDVNVYLARYLATTHVIELRRAIEGAAIAQQVVRESPKVDVEALAVLATCQIEISRYADAAQSIDQALASADPKRDQEHVSALHELQRRLPISVSTPD